MPFRSHLWPLALLLLFLHLLPAASYTCQTPLTFSEHRLPAILQIENVCSDNIVAMCLEFDGTVYLIQNMNPTTVYTVPTALQDCWVFRASDCAGEILLEHEVTGTRKLTVGCTIEATDASALDVSNSTPLDCSLTITPNLADVFNATRDTLPAEIAADIDEEGFADINAPMQFVDKSELLRGIYEMCFDLARHGIDTNSAFSVFGHVRAVIWHTESCHPELVGSTIGFAQAYLGLYGSAFALLHASNQVAGTWVENPIALTTEQEAAFQAIIDYAVDLDVSLDLPTAAIPTALHGLPSNGDVTVRAPARKARRMPSIIRPSGLTGLSPARLQLTAV